MLWTVIIGCGLCVWVTLSLMGSERSRGMSQIAQNASRENKAAAKSADSAKTPGAKPIR
jgi:hypothetical protein